MKLALFLWFVQVFAGHCDDFIVGKPNELVINDVEAFLFLFGLGVAYFSLVEVYHLVEEILDGNEGLNLDVFVVGLETFAANGDEVELFEVGAANEKVECEVGVIVVCKLQV